MIAAPAIVRASSLMPIKAAKLQFVQKKLVITDIVNGLASVEHYGAEPQDIHNYIRSTQVLFSSNMCKKGDVILMDYWE